MSPALQIRPWRFTDRPRGYTLLEVMIVIAILGVLAAVSYVSFRTVPRAAKVASTVMELTGELQSAKGAANARATRLIVLLYAENNQPIRYWTLLDPNLTVDNLMQTVPTWKKPEDLISAAPPATTAETIRVVNRGTFDPVITFMNGGFRAVRSNIPDARCTAYGASAFALASGTAAFSGYFPPPYCVVPDDAGCTFCNTRPDGVRGAIAFEAEGNVRLYNGDGVESPAGAGSLTFTAPDLPVTRGISIALTSAGLIHTFRSPK